MDNIVQQNEELEALHAIFQNQWKKCEYLDDTYSIKLAKDVEFWITLTAFYPSEKPPRYDLWAPNLSPYQKEYIEREFKEIYYVNQGFPVIFQWIEKLKDVIGDKKLSERKQAKSENQHIVKQVTLQSVNQLDIIHGPSITDRKSTFQAHVCTVTNLAQINQFKEELYKMRKIREAKHNILAYRITTSKNIILQDCDEDGENLAGGRLLHLLEILNVKNVAVIVTRWYGGIHLGADRFKHINNAARQAIKEAGLIK